ncbi:hypothetical protein [Clostridium beijerinckii]|uniref:hypothetical protein n=1 Tax=Clostridium beijerinckii TaxID=1520 RepID=UPI00055B4FE5|nr:hypothetical protein [Clostridium beijerinckii]
MRDEFLNEFLKKVKKTVAKKGHPCLAKDKQGNYRGKNYKFLIDNGLTLDHAKEAILQLSSKDKVGGPEVDRDGYPGYVFKFKSKYLIDEVIYIKIRFNPPDEVVCISFHDDE